MLSSHISYKSVFVLETKIWIFQINYALAFYYIYCWRNNWNAKCKVFLKHPVAYQVYLCTSDISCPGQNLVGTVTSCTNPKGNILLKISFDSFWRRLLCCDLGWLLSFHFRESNFISPFMWISLFSYTAVSHWFRKLTQVSMKKTLLYHLPALHSLVENCNTQKSVLLGCWNSQTVAMWLFLMEVWSTYECWSVSTVSALYIEPAVATVEQSNISFQTCQTSLQTNLLPLMFCMVVSYRPVKRIYLSLSHRRLHTSRKNKTWVRSVQLVSFPYS